MENKKKCMIPIKWELHKKLKILSAENSVQLKEFVELLLERGIKEFTNKENK